MRRLGIIVLIITLLTSTMSFGNNDEIDKSEYESFKIFVIEDGVAYSDFNIITYRYAQVDFIAEKNDGENFVTIYHKNSGEMKLFIDPKSEDTLAITQFHFDFSKEKGSELGIPNEDLIVSLDKPMLSLPLYKSNGEAIEDDGITYFHVKVGRIQDDPWVYNVVNVSPKGIIHLQQLVAGEYWLGIDSTRGFESNLPARMVFTVNTDKTITGLDEYIRYAAPDVDVNIQYKSGVDQFPYSTSINIYKKGTGSITRTWINAFHTKEGLPTTLSGFTDGAYEYLLHVNRLVNDPSPIKYDGDLVIEDGVYDFNLPSYLPVEILTSNYVNDDIPEQVSTLASVDNVILKQDNKILKFDEEIIFDDFNVKLLFPYRDGQPDEFITLRTLDRVKYGNELVDLEERFDTVFVSPTYELLVTAYGDTSPYEVVLPIDYSKVNYIRNISVYGYNATDKKWSNIGGKTNDFNGTIQVRADEHDIFVIAEGMPEFSDTDGAKWAISAIHSLASKGVVSGYDDMSFKPEKSISKAEFLSLVVKLCGLEGDISKVFEDTKGMWFQATMSTAVDFKLIIPVNGLVEPNKAINREEMAVILNNALSLYSNLEPTRESIAFEDTNSISETARESVQNAQKYGLISGKGNGFYPKDGANRAEATQVIYNFLMLLEYQNK